MNPVDQVKITPSIDALTEKAFEEFYESRHAQEYCFGNHNNATRDEQVGEFSFRGGVKWALEYVRANGMPDCDCRWDNGMINSICDWCWNKNGAR